MTNPTTAPAITAEQVAELRPVAELFRWARRNGWTRSESGVWQNAVYRDDATIRAAFGDNIVEVSRKSPGRAWPLWFTHYPVDSFRQGINVLAALDIIPAEFFVGEAPASQPTNPDRRCRDCGATTGLRLIAVNPLSLTYREWECVNVDDCTGSTR